MAVLHDALPVKPWMDPRLSRLPGIQPLDPQDWLRVDEAYGGQMALRAELCKTRLDDVHAMLPAGEKPARELLDLIEARLPSLGFQRIKNGWVCPDGRSVVVDRARPLLTLAHLLQEDFCILTQGDDGHHVLSAAILCFPASWMLSEKIGKGLPGIHVPVSSYDDVMGARVQRLFDAIRPEQPLWRANFLAYADPYLFQPRSETDTRPPVYGHGGFVRSERQCLVRLPKTRAVVFSIHTYVVRRETLSPEEEIAFAAITAAKHG